MRRSPLGAVLVALMLIGVLHAVRVSAGVNRCPVASDSMVSVDSGGSVNFQLMASDPDLDPLQYIVTQPPAHGTIVVQVMTGAASYTPAPGYCGPDSFKFKVNDGTCDSNIATVSITVNCLTSTPTATPTITPTASPTVTPTNTPRPNGADCTDPAQCASTFCVDGVCCDTACADPNQICNLPERLGVCTTLTGAPAMSVPAMVLAASILSAIGALSILGRRRGRR